MITSDKGFVIATPTKCGTTTLEEMCRRHRGGRAQPGLSSFRIMDWEQPRRQHRMALPRCERHGEACGGGGQERWDDAHRYLMVRNPFSRYVSMYEYLRAPHNYSKYGAREVQGREWRGHAMGREGLDTKPLSFERFLLFIADERQKFKVDRWKRRRGDMFSAFAYRSPWVWLDSLSDSAAWLAAQPGSGEVSLIELEHFWPSMATLKEQWGLTSLSVRPTIHANKTLTYQGRGWKEYWSGVSDEAVERVGVHAEVFDLDTYDVVQW